MKGWELVDLAGVNHRCRYVFSQLKEGLCEHKPVSPGELKLLFSPDLSQDWCRLS